MSKYHGEDRSSLEKSRVKDMRAFVFRAATPLTEPKPCTNEGQNVGTNSGNMSVSHLHSGPKFPTKEDI